MYNSKAIKICPNQHPQNPSYREFFENQKGPRTILGQIFHIIFDKKIYFVILYKLAKFHYETVFTSQVIH